MGGLGLGEEERKGEKEKWLKESFLGLDGTWAVGGLGLEDEEKEKWLRNLFWLLDLDLDYGRARGGKMIQDSFLFFSGLG